MSYRNFRLQVIIRICIIVVLLTVLIYFTLVDPDGIKAFFLLVFTILAVISLFYYVDQTNNEISGFLNAILNDDYSNRYSDRKKGKSFNAMYESFNAVNSKMNHYNQASESQYLYISTLVSQLQTGILSFDENGRVGLINEAIKRLLNVQILVQIKDIEAINADLFQCINNIRSGQSMLLKTSLPTGKHHFSITTSEFVLRGKYFKLISIQDIKGELEQTEMEAWQKLIRVLTHEIMNSISPITSLSDSLLRLLKLQAGHVRDDKLLEQLDSGLDAIKSRSDGLMKFTRDYRELTRIPLPKIRTVDGQAFFNAVKNLFSATLESNIKLSLSLPANNFQLEIDPDLMSQVLINLLKNASEAIESNPSKSGDIEIAVSNNQSTVIAICDTGPGIVKEVEEKMFIPFFTSKVNGSGIGLSLVKQIIQLHHGSISVARINDRTVFTIEI